jgi:hypothetical protein
MSTVTGPRGQLTTDGHELIAICRSTTPNTQENLEARASVGGDYRRMAAEERADIHVEMFGNADKSQVQ